VVIDLNVRTEPLNLLEENIGKTLGDIGTADSFLNRTPIGQEVRARIDKLGCTKLKSFCTAKETITRVKGQPTG
jgi:hypothetical protein